MKEFEKWLADTYPDAIDLEETNTDCILMSIDFKYLPPSMQKGVYEEFFLENGIQIGVDLISIEKAFEILKQKL